MILCWASVELISPKLVRFAFAQFSMSMNNCEVTAANVVVFLQIKSQFIHFKSEE